MKKICILCDFDGTITEKDGLYGFFTQYAEKEWVDIERQWEEGEINSQECLIKEFNCVPNLSEGLIDEYIKTIKIDPYFKKFYAFIQQNGIDFYIVSDGADYFINKILNNEDISGLKIISNHFELNGDKFKMYFPYTNQNCKKNAGTCKCAVVKEMKEKYDEVIYIGDGTSDYCAAGKTDKLFAKGKLIDYCKSHNINCTPFKTFKEIKEEISR